MKVGLHHHFGRLKVSTAITNVFIITYSIGIWFFIYPHSTNAIRLTPTEKIKQFCSKNVFGYIDDPRDCMVFWQCSWRRPWQLACRCKTKVQRYGTKWIRCIHNRGSCTSQTYYECFPQLATTTELQLITNINNDEVYEWDYWSTWSECTDSCGSGVQNRARECSHGPSDMCDGEASQDRECNTQPCPSWEEWTEWSSCSSSCGEGLQTRSRECNTIGGCEGERTETRACDEGACAEWLPWNEYSECSKPCGYGNMTRTRECTIQDGCDGRSEETKECHLKDCWLEWNEWSECSATCGSGSKTRSRSCSSEVASDCPGNAVESAGCTRPECTYSEWTDWSPCSQSCHKGTRQRQRECLAELCEENLEETEDCFTCCQPLDSNNQPVTKYFYKIDTDCTILNLDVQTSTYVPVCNKQWGTSEAGTFCQQFKLCTSTGCTFSTLESTITSEAGQTIKTGDRSCNAITPAIFICPKLQIIDETHTCSPNEKLILKCPGI